MDIQLFSTKLKAATQDLTVDIPTVPAGKLDQQIHPDRGGLLEQSSTDRTCTAEGGKSGQIVRVGPAEC